MSRSPGHSRWWASCRNSSRNGPGGPPRRHKPLRGALNLGRADAPAGLPGPVFEAARTRLGEARATAWEKWSETEISLGHHTAVIPDLARLVEEFPLREGLRANS